jgi:hypothetical protein
MCQSSKCIAGDWQGRGLAAAILKVLGAWLEDVVIGKGTDPLVESAVLKAVEELVTPAGPSHMTTSAKRLPGRSTPSEQRGPYFISGNDMEGESFLYALSMRCALYRRALGSIPCGWP